MSGATKKILFVEDEPIAQTIYKSRLERDGFETVFATDRAGVLKSLSEVRPDLVVLDLMVPKSEGSEVVRHFRSEEGLKKIPVLIVSNDYVTDLSQQAMELGANRGLFKTECTPARLAEAIRDMLGFVSAFDLSDKPAADDSQAEAFMAAVHEAHADEMTLKETRDEFLKKAPAEMAKIREHCLAFVKGGTTPAGQEHLNHLSQHVRFFATRAGLSGCVRMALLASAFEALLFEIVSKPERATTSTRQTIAQAVDSLERLYHKTEGTSEPNLKAKILVIDDDAVANKVMVNALKRAHFETASLDDPSQAVQAVQITHYDFVLLDINLKGTSGFEVCEKLRAMPEYKETPILFVTASTEFQNRARCILSGGNDLIHKPISAAELVLKTTLCLLQPQGQWAENSAVASVLKTTMRLIQQDELDAKPSATTKQKAAKKETQKDSPKAEDAPIPFNGPKPDAPAPTTPAAGKDEHSFSTEMLRKAWDSGHTTTHTSKDKTAKAEADKKEDTKISPPEIKAEPLKAEAPKVEPPKIEAITPAIAESKPAAAEPSPTLKMASDDATIEAPKAVEKAKPTNGFHKEELKPAEIKLEQPKAETPPAPVEKLEQPKIELPPQVPAAQVEVPPVAPPAPIVEAPPAAAPKETISQTNTETKDSNTMDTKPKPTFDDVARGVARIIFGDENITDMNVRLTRIALEKYNVPGNQKIDDVARGVTQIIFGDDKTSDMNVRLTKIALEKYNVAEVLHLNGANGVPA